MFQLTHSNHLAPENAVGMYRAILQAVTASAMSGYSKLVAASALLGYCIICLASWTHSVVGAILCKEENKRIIIMIHIIVMQT